LQVGSNLVNASIPSIGSIKQAWELCALDSACRRPTWRRHPGRTSGRHENRSGVSLVWQATHDGARPQPFLSGSQRPAH